MRIDSHQHFWKYDPQKHGWIDDTMSGLKRDFLPAHLSPLLEGIQFDACVAVQADQSEDETAFLLKLAEQNDFIAGVVGWLNLQADDLDFKLQLFGQDNRLVGLRHVIQDEPEVDFILGSKFQRGLSMLRKYDLTYDLLIFPKQLSAAIKTVELHPDLPFVIDHMAKPYIKTGELENWQKDIESMASHDNVYCKLSGMVTEASWTDWKYEDLLPYLDVVTNAFGTARLMFGSDWPVSTLAAGYKEVFEVIEQYFDGFSETEKRQVFGLNAKSFYNL